jgi:autotransporter-associated beta strand protein
MHIAHHGFTLAICCASVAVGQTLPTERTLRFADDTQADTAFSRPNQWRTRNEEPASLTAADGDGALTLLFRAANLRGYEANNDLGDENASFAINRIILAPAEKRLGDAPARAKISGKPLKLQQSPAGQTPEVTLGARDPRPGQSTMEVGVDLLLENDIKIAGDGNQNFRFSGAVRETKAGINVTKLGASAVVLSNKHNAWTGTTAVKGGALALADGATVGTGPLVIDAGATLAFVDAAGSAGQSSSLEIAEGGILDLNRNAWVIDYKDKTPFDLIYAAVRDGRIRSTTPSPTESIACVEARALGMTSYAGRKIEGNAVIVAVVRIGDTNLDSRVDTEDLKRVNAGYDKPGTWSDGDVTGDGAVNFDDLLRIAQHYDGKDGFDNDWRKLAQ